MTTRRAKEPAACDTMAELRAGIDALDDALIDLLARRSEYIDRAVVLKTREGLPPRTVGRVAEVLRRVRDAAETKNLDPRLVEALWTVLIEWGIEREATAMDRS